jgi:hypothetical protein
VVHTTSDYDYSSYHGSDHVVQAYQLYSTVHVCVTLFCLSLTYDYLRLIEVNVVTGSAKCTKIKVGSSTGYLSAFTATIKRYRKTSHKSRAADTCHMQLGSDSFVLILTRSCIEAGGFIQSCWGVITVVSALCILCLQRTNRRTEMV